MTVAAAATLAAVAPAPPGFRPTAESRNFVVYTRDESRVEVEKSQRFLDQLSTRLGVVVEGKRAYYRYSHAEDLGVALGTEATGAYLRGGEIHSSRAFDA